MRGAGNRYRPAESPKGDVIVVGESLIDEVVNGDRITRHPGGSPANVALGLARLGVSTRFHTAIGEDPDGKVISHYLEASGVTLTRGSVTSAPTSRAVATLGNDSSASYRFTLSWDPSPVDDLGLPALIHTGSLGAFLEPGAHVTAQVIRSGQQLGALISFDPNIRPSLMPDSDKIRKSFEDIAFRSQLTKLSDEDGRYLYPAQTPEGILALLLDAGVSVAAITRGCKGAYLGSGNSFVSIPGVATTISDTVGAGDSFMAALIWALVCDGEGWDGRTISTARLKRVGLIAAHAAGITVARPGADLPSIAELRLSEITV